jgi:hypothetical protein
LVRRNRNFSRSKLEKIRFLETKVVFQEKKFQFLETEIFIKDRTGNQRGEKETWGLKRILKKKKVLGFKIPYQIFKGFFSLAQGLEQTCY